MLTSYSKALDRDLNILTRAGKLQKLSGGLYYKPAKSVFGVLPPTNKELVTCFLRDNTFLLYTWNQYNSLNLGFTQQYNRVVVLNHKRHGVFKLGEQLFEFRRPNRPFPLKVSPEFLLVDLVNNLEELAEDLPQAKERISKVFLRFDQKKLMRMAQQFGKVKTKNFFKGLLK